MKHFACGDYLGAKELFRKAIKKDPTNSLAKDKLEKADILLNAPYGPEYDPPSSCRLPYSQGLDAIKNKDYVLARSKFIEVLNIDPENREAKRYLELCDRLIEKSK